MQANLKWQKVEMFNIGKAEEIYFSSTMNVYPANESRIESNVLSGEYDLSNPNNNTAQGFPALDYLLYGIGETENEIILKEYILNYWYHTFISLGISSLIISFILQKISK